MTGNFSWAALAILPLSMVANSATAKEQPQVRLQPVSSWNLDYAEDSCRMLRIFGSDQDKTAFYLEQYEPGEEFFVLVAGKPLNRIKQQEIKIQFGPAAPQQEESAILADFGDFGSGLMISNMSMIPRMGKDASASKKWGDKWPPAIRAPEADITWVEFSKIGTKNLVLELGAMEKPMDALRACTDNLLGQWGIDIESHKTLTRKAGPANNPRTWLVPDDYPTQLLRKNEQGLVQFRLMVGTDGLPESCHIQKSTRGKAFDDLVCEKVMERARLKPALDANGQPIRSYYRSSVRFAVG